jgi:hypothetical protein
MEPQTGEPKNMIAKETMNPCPNAGIFKYHVNEDGKWCRAQNTH